MCRNLLFVLSVAVLLGPAGVRFAQAAASPAAVEKDQSASLDSEPSLVGWWKLDEVSDKNAADSSKQQHNGTLEGDLSFEKDSVPGRIGKALKFDGKGGVVVTGYKGVAGTHPRTVVAWIKTKDSRGNIVVWGQNDFGKMWIFGFVRGHVGVTPSGGYLYINERINDDQWHQVAAVVNKGDPPNLHDSVDLYVDGAPAAIHNIGLLDLWPVDTGSEADVRIGDRFNGDIDDVRIYDRALSVDEVNALFRQK